MRYYKSILYSLILTFSFLVGALAQSQDLFPPTIKLGSGELAEYASKSEGVEVFEAVVEDDVKIFRVTLYFRYNGQAEYRSMDMRLIRDTSNIYVAKIKSGDQEDSRIEYYIDAEDTSGNFSLKGQQFNPLLRGSETVAPLAASELLKGTQETNKSTEPGETETNSRSNVETPDNPNNQENQDKQDEGTASHGGVSRFHVNVEPMDARIRIMNIAPKYFPGIELEQGDSYRVVVDKAGYQHYDNWIVVRNAEETLDVTLVSKSDILRSKIKNDAGKIEPCFDAVQNNIAWDYADNKSWLAGNIEILCGNVGTVEPAMCFSTVMHGDVDWGGGTKWHWENALNLCSKTQNAQVTVQCFQEKIQSGSQWEQAIALCKKI